MVAAQIRPEGGVRKGLSQALIGQKVGTVAKWRLRAVPGVDWDPETGRLEAVEAVGNTVPRKARYSWTVPVHGSGIDRGPRAAINSAAMHRDANVVRRDLATLGSHPPNSGMATEAARSGALGCTGLPVRLVDGPERDHQCGSGPPPPPTFPPRTVRGGYPCVQGGCDARE